MNKSTAQCSVPGTFNEIKSAMEQLKIGKAPDGADNISTLNPVRVSTS